MSPDIRPRNAVLDFVENGPLNQNQAEDILPHVSQPTISNYLRNKEKYSKERSQEVNLNRDEVLKLVEQGVLTQGQAGDILGIGQSAVAQALD